MKLKKNKREMNELIKHSRLSEQEICSSQRFPLLLLVEGCKHRKKSRTPSQRFSEP